MKKDAVNFTFLYKKYPGQWVALADDEKTVLGSGKTVQAALQSSKKNGYAHPILHRVPKAIGMNLLVLLAKKAKYSFMK